MIITFNLILRRSALSCGDEIILDSNKLSKEFHKFQEAEIILRKFVNREILRESYGKEREKEREIFFL